MTTVKKIRGGKFQSFARVVANIFTELVSLRKRGLKKCHRGILLSLHKDDERASIISQWKIGEVDGCLYSHFDVLNSMCIKSLVNTPALLSSREVGTEDKNLAVAIRIKVGNDKMIAVISGLTKEANEALIILASVDQDYLYPAIALQIVERGQNRILLDLKPKPKK